MSTISRMTRREIFLASAYRAQGMQMLYLQLAKQNVAGTREIWEQAERAAYNEYLRDMRQAEAQ